MRVDPPGQPAEHRPEHEGADHRHAEQAEHDAQPEPDVHLGVHLVRAVRGPQGVRQRYDQAGGEVPGPRVEPAKHPQHGQRAEREEHQQDAVRAVQVAQGDGKAGHQRRQPPAGRDGERDAHQRGEEEGLREHLGGRVLRLPDLEHVRGQQQPDRAGRDRAGQPPGEHDREQHREDTDQRSGVGQRAVAVQVVGGGHQRRPQVVELRRHRTGRGVGDPDTREPGARAGQLHRQRVPGHGRIHQGVAAGVGDDERVHHVPARVLVSGHVVEAGQEHDEREHGRGSDRDQAGEVQPNLRDHAAHPTEHGEPKHQPEPDQPDRGQAVDPQVCAQHRRESDDREQGRRAERQHFGERQRARISGSPPPRRYPRRRLRDLGSGGRWSGPGRPRLRCRPGSRGQARAGGAELRRGVVGTVGVVVAHGG